MSGNGLFGSTTLDVVIGLVFVYLLLAILCTTINEWIAGILKTRSSTLKSAIGQLLDRQAGVPDSANLNWFLQQFYSHPLITGMNQPGKPDSHPAYLSARAFATTVMDIVTQQKQGVLTFADLETGINSLPPGDVKKALLSLIQNANSNLNHAQRNIEAWFNDTMDRASGWYKRRTQVWTVVIASALTLAANADTLQIAKTLWTDPTLRAQIVEQSKEHFGPDQNRERNENRDDQPPPGKTLSRDDLKSLGQMLGWNQPLPKRVPEWLDRMLGWFLSIVAISLGAPFWFDTLNKFMRIRNSGDNPQEIPPSAVGNLPPAPAVSQTAVTTISQ
jgi:hypothetical protein